jgi:2-epi-5-epi-valiolone synthase
MNNNLNNNLFSMTISHSQKIEMKFENIFKFLSNFNNNRKIIFIDPVVLANNNDFLKLEEEIPNLILVPTNLYEATKNIDSLLSIISVLEENSIGRRNEIILAVGGGALLDIVSFAASIYRRGIHVIKVPTSLLGIVDASVGIKTGINYSGQRNRLGTYHFDYSVIIDTKLLNGLSKAQLRQGLGEIFKIAVIKSKNLFNKLIKHTNELEDVNFYNSVNGINIMTESIKLMIEELENNPREENLERCVDFGHSFSPFVEMASINRKGTRILPHGYAVAYDCLLSTTISKLRNIISNEDYEKIIKLYKNYDFDLSNEIYLDTNLMWSSFLELIKHRGGSQNFPVPTKIGSYTFLQDVTFEEVQKSADFLSNYIKA